MIAELNELVRSKSERTYGEPYFVIYLHSQDEVCIGGNMLRPYCISSQGELKASFNAPNRTIVTYSDKVTERLVDTKSYEKYGGLKYIYEPMTNEIASEILKFIK